MAELKVVTVAGKDALAELDRLRSLFAKTGLYPVLFGRDDDCERIREGMEEAFDPAAILAASREIDPLAWFDDQGVEEEDPDEVFGEDDLDGADDAGLFTHRNVMTRKPHKEVTIGLLEVTESWEVFAHLNWGSWNACPSPAEHCALHRYWAAEYGAEVVSVTGDIVQNRVARLPATDARAYRLAREQYAYCGDIVDQGIGTVEALAATLRVGRTWYFWWD